MKFGNLLAGISLAAGVMLTLGLTIVKADPEIVLKAVTAKAATQFSWGQCPCFRWSVKVTALSGKIEWKDFLISTDAFFEYQNTSNAQFQRLMSEKFSVGMIEALWKGGHLGLGFDGVTVGDDLDRSNNDILKTGLYLLVSMVNTMSKNAENQGVRFDFRSGYDFDQRMFNLQDTITRHRLNEAIVFNWNTGAFSGHVKAGVYIDPRDFTSLGSYNPYASVGMQARFLNASDLKGALTFDVSADRDTAREAFGLSPNNVTGVLGMSLSWVPKALQIQREE